jgi:hypothetical protein
MGLDGFEQAPVDGVVDTGGVCDTIGCEEHHNSGDLLWLRHPARRQASLRRELREKLRQRQVASLGDGLAEATW